MLIIVGVVTHKPLLLQCALSYIFRKGGGICDVVSALLPCSSCDQVHSSASWLFMVRGFGRKTIFLCEANWPIYGMVHDTTVDQLI